MPVRAFRVTLPSGERYWTVVDHEYRVVGDVDEYLRHLRFGQDCAESTTKAYAESLALYLRWCERSERDWRTGAERMGAFVTWLKHTPSDPEALSVGPGLPPVRGPGRINRILAAYYQAIGEALASGERLDGLGQLPQFDQAQSAGFLRALATQLDALRPWPEPKFRRLEPSTWSTFEQAVPIARLDASVVEVTDVLQKGFRPTGDAEAGLYVMMLKLATGDTVALLGFYARGGKSPS